MHHSTLHGMYKTRFYKTFSNMKSRCNKSNNTKAKFYKRYAGRGIKCLWKSFEEFRDDMYESYLEHVDEYGEKQTTLDRIDNNGNYCKENCRWATYKEQMSNTKNIESSIKYEINGQMLTIRELSKIYGIKRTTLGMRLQKYLWSLNRALEKK